MDLEKTQDDISMCETYDSIVADYDFLEDSPLATSEASVQARISKAIENGERLVTMVNELGLFSANEDAEDIATKDLKYLLLPAYLAYFKSKQLGDRFEIAKQCRTYSRHFIQLCKLYGLTTISLPPLESQSDDADSKTAPAADPSKLREEKVKRFKAKKQLELELAELKKSVSAKNADEQTLRDFHLKLIEKWIGESVANIESVDQELQILAHFSKLSLEKPGEQKAEKPNAGKFQPFIIARDSLQKAVFGLGYPSVPVYSVDEFYDQRVAQGLFPSEKEQEAHRNKPPSNHDDEEEAVVKETAVERDDEDEIRRMRNWDEFRDDHRRGWGNTHNKG